MAVAWAKAVGSTLGDSFGGVAVRNGVTVGVATVRTEASVDGDIYLASYQANTGALNWSRVFGSSTTVDAPTSVALAPDGTIIVTGRFSKQLTLDNITLVANNGSTDIFLAKFDASGAVLWAKRFGGVIDDVPAAVTIDNTGNIYLTGYFRGTVNFGGADLSVPFTSDLDVFLAKFSPSGAHLWSKNFVNDGNDRGYGIAVDGTGSGVAITGTFSNTINFGVGGDLTAINARTDLFVAKFNAMTGAPLWAKRFGAPDASEAGNGIAMDSAGNVVVVGTCQTPIDFGGGLLSGTGTDAFLVKLTGDTGAYIWSRRIGGGGNDYGYGVAVDQGNGSVTVVGQASQSVNFGDGVMIAMQEPDIFLARYNSGLSLLNAQRFGGSNAENVAGLAVDGTNAAYVAGYFYGSGTFAGGIPLLSAGMADGMIMRVVP
jgi:hypothetical protein